MARSALSHSTCPKCILSKAVALFAAIIFVIMIIVVIITIIAFEISHPHHHHHDQSWLVVGVIEPNMGARTLCSWDIYSYHHSPLGPATLYHDHYGDVGESSSSSSWWQWWDIEQLLQSHCHWIDISDKFSCVFFRPSLSISLVLFSLSLWGIYIKAVHIYRVISLLLRPKNDLVSTRLLGNSDTENFFNGIYYLIWHSELLRAD